jgi:hypothetical protein
MAWKNLQQTTLLDAMLIDHEALKELDDVHEFIDWSIDVSTLGRALEDNAQVVPEQVIATKPLPLFKSILTL